MTATVDNKLLESLPQVGEKIAVTSHLTTVQVSASPCQVCNAPARLCGPELLQQAVSALLGVPVSTAVGALCAHCSNLAAQACHLRTQLEELDEQLRHFHIRTLYFQLENRDSGALNSDRCLPGGEKEADADRLTCRLCAGRFASTAALLRHLRSQHGADAPPGVRCSAGPCGPCTVCRCGQAAVLAPGRGSPAPSDGGGPARGADRSHTASPAAEGAARCRRPLPSVDGQLACAACPQRFDSAQQRRRHQRQAHPLLLPHACRLCAKRFPSPSKLRIHEDSHAGARPHACEVCGRRYHSAQKLHVHARSHTGERPFVCHMCGTFASAAYLSQHELTHTGRRPHQCHVCGKQFTQRGTMMKHVRNVHAALADQQTGAVAVPAQGVTTGTDCPASDSAPVHKLGTRLS